MGTKLRCFIVFILVLCLSVSVMAAKTWDDGLTNGGTSHLWVTAANWVENGVPDSASDSVYINPLAVGRVGPTIEGSVLSCRQIRVDVPIGNTTTITMNNGTLVVGAGYPADSRIWLISGSGMGTANLILNSSSLTVADGGELRISGFGARGHVQINDGMLNVGVLTIRSGGTIDITGSGMLVIDFDVTSLIQEYADGNVITAYDGAGVILINYSGGKTTVTSGEPEIAYHPSPFDTETEVAVDAALSWTAVTDSHDVYFGTSQSAVANARRLAGDVNGNGHVDILDLLILASQWLTDLGSANPSADIEFSGRVDIDDFAILAADWNLTADAEFKGNRSGTTYDPGILATEPTYYWRIDEVDGTGTTIGTVWSFTTGEAVKIMPLGDSITQGDTTRDNYRHHLWDKLRADGYTKINFVGSHNVLSNDVIDILNFDKDHDGHSGWKTDEILTGGAIGGGDGNLTVWLNDLQATGEVPDIVLMHLGTNDVNAGQDNSQTIGEMEDIIDVLRSYNPNVTVLVAKVIPCVRPPGMDALNALIPSLDTYETATSEVIIVDHNTGFLASWLFDDVHPNAIGAAEMSDRWYTALLPLLPLP